MSDQRIDFSKHFSSANEQESRQNRPERETRPQPEKERNPDYHTVRERLQPQRQDSGWGGERWSGKW